MSVRKCRDEYVGVQKSGAQMSGVQMSGVQMWGRKSPPPKNFSDPKITKMLFLTHPIYADLKKIKKIGLLK